MPVLSQAESLITITTPLADGTLVVERMSVTERVSEPFEIVLDLLSEDAAIDPDALLRKPITITVAVDDDGNTRHFHGLVRRFVQLDRGPDLLVMYRAEVVPAIWFLSLAVNCRIFQDKSTPDIVKGLLAELGVTDVKTVLTATYNAREYCVQYRETHLAFISRLLEEEGIFYFFEHTDSTHTFVMADSPSAVKPGPVATLPVRLAKGALSLGTDFIRELEVENRVCSSTMTLVDYNPLLPRRLLSTLGSSPAKPSGANLTVFDYPGGFAASVDGDRLTRVRMEERESLRVVVKGQTTCRALGSGQKLTVSAHYRDAVNGDYQLLSLTHVAEIAGYRTSTDAMSSSYVTTFVAIPFAVPYRPPQVTPKSIVYGTQTALVVGTAGEEIYVDKYGRVKVQFYWDQLGVKDDKSSCWVRVSSSWAGKNWGAIQIPRIGQEVVVDFLEGDPDRPIITGRVYNGEQMPPYDLPANGTQSGVKSRSSKSGGADNFNELRFEDSKGSEVVSFQAEKDLTSLVKNDESRTVNHDRTTTIKNNETKTVSEGDEATTISKGNRTFDITTGNETKTIAAGNQTLAVSKGDQTITVDAGKQTITVDKDRSVTIKTGNNSLVVKTGNHSTEVTTGNHETVVKTGNHTTTINTGNMSTDVKLGNHATKADLGNITITASVGQITIEALQGIELKSGPASIKIEPAGVTIKGLKISVAADVMTEVKGAMVQVSGDGMLTLKGGITMIN